MALAAGTRLGAYEVTGQLGVGGMGEVYRARDTKLGREVALKTLPSALAQDPERLARFEREAKLLAALNHAHIGAIYGLDEHEGTQFIAMELIEGQTLEDKLKDGRLPVEEALRVALQIAEALETAHEKGVIHRDLKPANIMLTRDGVVKVLDFGLAKAFSGNPNEASPLHSPTLSMAMTQQGLILGTAGYMSPEQASGQATDQRADIWAFGVVLYEMLTGLPLFRGESVPHILAAVLQTEPDWGRLPKDLHPRLRLLLERCLEKKVRNRYHSISDVRVDIEKVLNDPEGASTQFAAPGVAYTKSIAARLVTVVGLMAVGGILAGMAAWWVQPSMEPPIVSRLEMPQPSEHPLTLNGYNYDIALSPDGARIVYRTLDAGRIAIVARDLDSFDTRVLYTGGVVLMFFSPDGESVGFVDGNDGKLYRVPIAGGPAISIATVGGFPRGASWGIDDRIIFGTGPSSGLWVVAAGGGEEPASLTELDEAGGEINHLWPQVLPGGDAILFTIQSRERGTTTTKVALRNLVTGEQRVLVQDGSDARYVPTGHLVYAFEGTLRAVPFDVENLEVTGNPVPVLDGVVTTDDGAAEMAIARNGTMAYVMGTGESQGRSIVWVDRAGREEPIPMDPEYFDEPVLSPDNTRVALRRPGDIWLWSFEQDTLTRLTFEAGEQSAPLWTPDGERIVYRSSTEGLVWRSADGAGPPEVLLPTTDPVEPFAWSADGDLIYSTVSGGRNGDIGMMTPGANTSPRLLLATEFDEGKPALSPDGKWIAYVSNETGQSEVYVRSFPDMGPRLPVSAGGGDEPTWSADGRELFFLGPTAIMVSEVTTEPTFSRRPPNAVVSRGNYRFAGTANSYDVSEDGERLLLIKSFATSGPPPRLVVVQNWFEELERL